MVYDEYDLIKAINEALVSANDALEISKALQDAAGDPIDKAKLNLIKERAQLIIDFLGDDAVTDFLADLDAREPVVDYHRAERHRLLNQLKDDLNPDSQTYISFLNVRV